MEKMEYDSFENYHPIVNFIYFLFTIGFTMFFMHPIFQFISFIIGSSYLMLKEGKRKTFKFIFKYMLPILILTAALNPLFNHQGATMLFYLKSGNPVTLESIIFGFSSGLMFISIIIWFKSYNSVITSDKVIYLFGNIIPSLSLIFSMTLRFIPMYAAKIKEIARAQKAIGKDISSGSIISRIKNGLSILSIMITWALQNAIETSDSMKARGYGIGSRTNFSNYTLTKRDKLALASMLIFIAIISYGAYLGIPVMKFFPAIKIKESNYFSILVYISYIGLMSLPIVINIQEELEWKYIESKI